MNAYQRKQIKEQQLIAEGYRKGYEQGNAEGIKEGIRRQTSNLQFQKMELGLKLMSNVGQTIQQLNELFKSCSS